MNVQPGRPLSEPQVLSIGAAEGRVNLWEGSIRAGKSVAALLRYFGALVEDDGAGAPLVIGRSRDTLYRNVFEPIERDPMWGFVRSHIRYRQGAAHATIMGRRVAVIGANDVGSAPRLQGMTAGKVLGDEAATWHPDVLPMLLGRMSPASAQAFLTTNPDNPFHPLKAEHIDAWAKWQRPDWRVFHFTMHDNPGLTPEYVEAISREYTGLWHRRFVLGEWVSAEGAVYGDFSRERHVIPWHSIPPLQMTLAVGLDYGTSNASAAVILGLTDEYDALRRPTPRLIALDEWRWDSHETQQRLTDVAQSRLFRQWLEQPHTPHDMRTGTVEPPQYVFRDPAATSLGEQLQVDGVQAWLADNDVLPGIADVANLLTTGRLLFSDRCKGLIREAPGYLWDAKATAKGKDAPVKANDHSLDALRYAVRSSKSLWAPVLVDAYGEHALLLAA